MSSLADFAANQKPVPGDCERWFDQHSGLLDEVVAGFQQGVPANTIWRWLRQEHGYPLSNRSIHYLRGRFLS